MKLSDICENSDANNFDFHTFLFESTYLMIDHAFIFKLLHTSGDVSFHSNNTILPSLYALLNLNLDLPPTQSWFESRFPFYNTNFVLSIRDLPFHASRCRFLNFEHHNQGFQEIFYNDFLGRAHFISNCDICTEHDRISFSHVNQELSHLRNDHLTGTDSKFRLFTHDFEPSVKFHKCSSCCHTGANHKQNIYSFSYESMLIYLC